MQEGFDKFMGAMGNAIDTAPTFYEDALQPTAKEVGKLAARIPRAINAVFSGFDKWIYIQEYNLEETKKKLAQKLQNEDPKKIGKPDPSIAVPTIQAIAYSANSDELRELYANLLAAAMNLDTRDMVHPSFIEIIKQLSPIDAKIFNEIDYDNNDEEQEPVVIAKLGVEFYELKVDANGTTAELDIQKTWQVDDLTSIQFAERSIVTFSLENLSRLNLIKRSNPFIDKYPNEDSGFFYRLSYHVPKSFKRSLVYNEYKMKMQKDLLKKNTKAIETYQYIEYTSFGQAFFDVCVKSSS